MPLYKTIPVTNKTKVLVWKIQESYQGLLSGLELTNSSFVRFSGMKSEIHKAGYLSIRHLLAIEGYSDNELFYDELGKPHLKDGTFISITHSFQFSAIILSKETPVGIDIEKQRDKIARIANKFTPLEEYRTIANHEALIRKLTIVWGAKESLYKIYAQEGLSFIKNIYIQDFNFDDSITSGTITFNEITTTYSVCFLEFEGFTCVYAIK